MSIKLVVVDMDGTFLDDNNQYDTARFATIFENLRAQQIKFAVASGSQFQRLQAKFPDYLDEMFFISQNGSVIFDGQNFLGASPVADQDLAQVLTKVSQYPAGYISQIVVSGVKKTYIDARTPEEIKALINEYYSDLAVVPDILTIDSKVAGEAITKIGIRFSSKIENLETVVADFRASLPTKLASLNSGFNVELVGLKEVDKVTGIKFIKEQLAIVDEEIMTFGDNENDAAMLALTPHSYAMANGSDHVKKIAKHQAPSNNEAGVLTVLEQLFAE